MAARVAFLLMVAISVVAAVPTSTLIDHINNAQDSWTAGINSLSDKTDEYKKQLCGALPEPEDVLPVKEDIEILENIPASFDARKHWPNCPSINSIKTQGQCKSSWAIAAASSLSDRLCIASNSKVKLNISEENLTFCCSACAPSGGCVGGLPQMAWNHLKTVGVVTGGDFGSNEGCQPYEVAPHETVNFPQCEKTCTNKKYGKSYESDLHFSKNAYRLLTLNIKAMQSEILKYGPVEAVFQVYYDLYSYKTGVYQYVSGDYQGDQAVRVIGWGTEKGTPYWLAANSWGRGWGENGFFKILRGSDECKFEEAVYAGQAKY